LLVVTTLFALCVACMLLPLSPGFEDFVTTWLYDGVVLAAGAVCIAGGLAHERERTAWILVGVAILLWGLGDVIWTLGYQDNASPPYPSISDGFWLAIYPPLYVATLLLLGSRVGHVRRTVWLDGVIGGLAVASLAAAVVFEAVLEATSGSRAAVATNLAYPLADLLLIALVVAAIGLTSWRIGSRWGLLACGLLVFAMSDCLYLFQTASGSYVAGGFTDLGWIAGCVVLAWAAWQPVRRETAARLEGGVLLLAPVGFGLIALAVLVYDHFVPVNTLTLVLASTAILAVIGRMALSFVENARMLARSRDEARTDALTGLWNRRRLLDDLERHVDGDAGPALLALFDLNGFKQYNDVFGHPAGDALLTRIGGSLSGYVGSNGTAYRMGGDEFCILCTDPPAAVDALLQGAALALEEHGEGFSVTASCGAVLIPEEAATPSEALRRADQRLYEQKRNSRSSATEQSSSVLVRALTERDPTLAERLARVAELAEAVAARLELPPDETARVRLAASLHDVGKISIPDAILEKPGPLSSADWTFLYRHTLVAERILSGAPDLSQIAGIVRWSHERFDGTGYPDGLVGSEIPLAARIVFVCDAFDAMISKRPYAAALSIDEALAELRRCAGTQFDPEVVRAFEGVLADRRSHPTQAEFGHAVPRLRLVAGA
jgi:diguanylate cyclase (GGDEF)-like protein